VNYSVRLQEILRHLLKRQEWLRIFGKRQVWHLDF
jgi:hypothetical protein